MVRSGSKRRFPAWVWINCHSDFCSSYAARRDAGRGVGCLFGDRCGVIIRKVSVNAIPHFGSIIFWLDRLPGMS